MPRDDSERFAPVGVNAAAQVAWAISAVPRALKRLIAARANALGPGKPAHAAEPDPDGLAFGVACGDAFPEGLEVEPVKRHRSERTGEGILASARLRAWHPVGRFRNARPW